MYLLVVFFKGLVYDSSLLALSSEAISMVSE